MPQTVRDLLTAVYVLTTRRITVVDPSGVEPDETRRASWPVAYRYARSLVPGRRGRDETDLSHSA